MASQFWLNQLNKQKTLADQYFDAMTALLTEGVQEYTLDTGQDKQTVKKFDLPELQNSLDAILNNVATLEIRCGIAPGSTIVRPLSC